MKRLGIVGVGRVGTLMAYLLAQQGYQIQIALRQSTQSALVIKEHELPIKNLAQLAQASDILFITTPDGVIASVTQKLSKIKLPNLKGVIHMSGAYSSDVLLPLKEQGIAIGVLHPLQSFSSLDQSLVNLKGSTFTFEGDDALIPWLTLLVASFDGKLVIAPPAIDKTLYHAGASIASNFLVLLAGIGIACLTEAGFNEGDSQEALIALMKGTLNNLTNLPPAQALTGPIVRGDVTTVKNHIAALKEHLPHMLPAYHALGELTADLAWQSGNLSLEHYQEFKKII